MVDYVINADTLIVIPFGDKQTKVIEKNRELILDYMPNRLIKKNCLFYGSSMDNRQKWTESITGDVYKVPIALREDGSIIIFPTASPRLKNVAWILLNNVNKVYYDRKNRATVVEFVNNFSIFVDSSINIMNNQLLKATRLEYLLRKNRE